MGPLHLDAYNFNNFQEAWSGFTLEEIEDYDYQEVAASFFQEEINPTANECVKTKTYKESWIS